MNQPRHSLLYPLWLALALALSPALSAQEAPPAQPAPEPPAIETPAPAAPEVEKTDEAKSDASEAAVDAEKAGEAEMRELAPASGDTETKPEKSSRKSRRSRSVSVGSSGGDRPPLGSHRVRADDTWREAVSIMGSTVVDGRVTSDAVSVMGSTTVNGSVGGAAVAVLGDVTVNGTVDGDVVAVLGDVILGPKAIVRGEIVCVLGQVIRSDSAQVHGGVQEIGGFGPFHGFEWLRAWIVKCLAWGRPLGFGENLGWVWMVAGAFLVFYMLLALLFPRGIDRCVENLEQRPGGTFLAAVLAALLSPVLIVLLAVTGIGIVLIPFVMAGLFLATLFGKAAILAWFGRRLTNQASGFAAHPVVAVLLGGVIVSLLYCVWILGMILWAFFAVLGMGMVVYTLALSMQKGRAPATAVAANPPAPAVSAAGVTPVAAPAATATPAAEMTPPVVPPEGSFAAAAAGSPMASGPAPAAAPLLSASTLPRAGFWIRVAASLLDFLLVGIVFGVLSVLDGPGPLFLGLAAYHAAMWKFKGTTIGGIICGLKVVRLDDRPIDWGVAIVRVLAAFLSFVVVFLGFIWVAFDDEKQSWHDKIAGTTIVKVPKGTPLL